MAYYETAATDVSNKVDTRKRQRVGAVGGLGCEEQNFDEFPLGIAKLCGLPPLYRNFENFQHSSTNVRTRFRTLASRKCSHAMILLTNILNSQAMLFRATWNAPKTARGEFEHCRACVLGVIAPAPVRHALSNNRRVWSTKRVTGAQRCDMNVDATVAPK